MPAIEKIAIALSPEMLAQVRLAVETGEYASSSEVVRDALHDWTSRRQPKSDGVSDARRLWQEARAEMSPGEPAEAVLDQLERKYQSAADAKGLAADEG